LGAVGPRGLGGGDQRGKPLLTKGGKQHPPPKRSGRAQLLFAYALGLVFKGGAGAFAKKGFSLSWGLSPAVPVFWGPGRGPLEGETGAGHFQGQLLK